MGSTKQMIDKA